MTALITLLATVAAVLIYRAVFRPFLSAIGAV